ncbi:MAG: diphthine--ammonia ligase [Desulfurococcaceae archaeon]
MRATVLYSGGKDSTMALHWAVLQGMDVPVLITIYPERGSELFHYPCIELTKLQAESMGLEIMVSEAKGDELRVLGKLIKDALKKYGVNALVIGVVESDYQRMRIAQIAIELGLKLYTPLWRRDPVAYMKELLELGIKYAISSISTMGLSPMYVGRIVDECLLKEILALSKRYGFHPSFEGGEAETIVLEAPLFKSPISIHGILRIYSDLEAELVPIEARFSNKPEVVIKETVHVS